MNYAYDITLNFNKEYIDFYEWNKEDNIEYYLKVPIFKITNESFYDIFYNDISVNKKFLDIIKYKTEKYSKNGVVKCSNIALFTNMNSTIVLKFNNNGDIIFRSSLSIDEEDEILTFSKMIKYYLLEYKVNNKIKTKKNFVTRNEQEKKINLYKKLKDIYIKKEYEKLLYIYYEVYNEKNDNYEKIYYKLINLLNNNNDRIDSINDIVFNNKKKSTYI